MNNKIKIIMLGLLVTQLSGCFLTKVVTVPLRVTGSIVSVIPVIGNVVDGALDATADTIDIIPL
jgi:hypothetical protein